MGQGKSPSALSNGVFIRTSSFSPWGAAHGRSDLGANTEIDSEPSIRGACHSRSLWWGKHFRAATRLNFHSPFTILVAASTLTGNQHEGAVLLPPLIPAPRIMSDAK